MPQTQGLSKVMTAINLHSAPKLMAKTRQKVFEYVEPIGARVLVRKDDPKRETKGGIALPDAAEIPTLETESRLVPVRVMGAALESLRPVYGT